MFASGFDFLKGSWLAVCGNARPNSGQPKIEDNDGQTCWQADLRTVPSSTSCCLVADDCFATGQSAVMAARLAREWKGGRIGATVCCYLLPRIWPYGSRQDRRTDD